MRNNNSNGQTDQTQTKEELAFRKMTANEISDKEHNPFDEYDKGKQPFYRGILTFNDRRQVVYFRLLNLDKFVYKAYTPSEIFMRTFQKAPHIDVMKLSDWLQKMNNAPNYTPEEKARSEVPSPEIESDKIRYLSENARNYGSPSEDDVRH